MGSSGTVLRTQNTSLNTQNFEKGNSTRDTPLLIYPLLALLQNLCWNDLQCKFSLGALCAFLNSHSNTNNVPHRDLISSPTSNLPATIVALRFKETVLPSRHIHALRTSRAAFLSRCGPQERVVFSPHVYSPHHYLDPCPGVEH